MTVLLDAYALVAYLRGERAAPTVRRLLWDGELVMSAVQLAEVLDRMERVHGIACDDVEVAVSALGIEVLSADYPVAAEAGRLRARHYGPTGRTLSLADSFCAATAVLSGASLATADSVLLMVAETEGCTVVRLPTAA